MSQQISIQFEAIYFWLNIGECKYSFTICRQMYVIIKRIIIQFFNLLVTKTCGESTSQNCTYFQNTGYPSTYDNVGSCQLTINKCSSNVCQLRYVLLKYENVLVIKNWYISCYSYGTKVMIFVINYSCRLDFDNFVLAQPESTDHVCQNDQFVVSGGPPIPAVCGVNTGLHSKFWCICVKFKLLDKSL